MTTAAALDLNRPDQPRAPERAGAAVIAAALGERIAVLARELAGDPTEAGRHEWRFRRRGSLAVLVTGPKRGSWYDHEAGEGGDALDLVRHLLGGTTADALRWSTAWLGLPAGAPARAIPAAPARGPEPAREAERAEAERLALAARIWREAVEPRGTLAERYLAARRLALPADVADLRFHPACPRGPERLPAMVALMRDASTNEPRAIHRTFLKSDGSGKAEGRAKAMLGPAGGAVVKLVDDADAVAGLGLAEGIETALAVIGAGWRPVWAAGSAGAIRTFPVLAGLEALTIFADGDAAGLTAARACAARWAAASREAFVERAPAAHDHADLLASAC